MRGACRSRTGVRGFAGLCLTTRPRRQVEKWQTEKSSFAGDLLSVFLVPWDIFLAPSPREVQAPALSRSKFETASS